MNTTHTPPTGWRQVAGVVVGLTTVLTVLLVAFAWPPSEMEPRGVPIAVASPPGAGGQVTSALAAAAGEEAFTVTPVETREQAVALVEQREAYGAVVIEPAAPEMLVASAASPVVAQMLGQVGTQLAGQAGTRPVVTDVVPLPAADPRGAVFAAGAFPLVIGGIAVGSALALRVPGRTRKVAAALAVAALAGSAMAAVQQFWFDALGGSYWANAGVYALAVAAMAAVVVGLHRILGVLGLGLAAGTILLLGNPLSAISSAPELLPDGWSTLGQLLPPGAAGSALRSTAFFDGAAALAPLTVLAAWLLVGLVLVALPARQPAVRRTGAVTERAEAPQPVA